MYAVRLRKDVMGYDDVCFHVTMELAINLPFVPVPGVSFGLLPDSDFSMDESRVERVMWHHGRKEFFVELEGFRHPEPQGSVRWLHENGWTVRTETGSEDVAEAHHWCRDSDLPAAVRVGGLWVSASASELWALQHCGQAQEVSPVPAVTPPAPPAAAPSS